jgi:hypothetical protein
MAGITGVVFTLAGLKALVRVATAQSRASLVRTYALRSKVLSLVKTY